MKPSIELDDKPVMAVIGVKAVTCIRIPISNFVSPNTKLGEIWYRYAFVRANGI